MGDDCKSVQVAYTDRWRWLKHMLAQPTDVLGNGVKVVLVAVWEAMDKKTGITVRLQSTIAEATGLKPGTVKDYLSVARKAGFVHSEGKGGHVFDETGKKVPLASRYRLALPATVVATWDASSDENEGKGRLDGEQVAMKTRARGDDSRYNTPSVSPSSSPVDSPRAFDGREEVENTLPVASLKERSGWLDWPDAEPIPYTEGPGEQWRWFKIMDLAMRLVGWQSGTDENRSQYAAINDTLKHPEFEWRKALLERYEAGTLTKADIANVLAVSGINPPIAAEREMASNG